MTGNEQWMPWYDRMATMDSAREREEYVKSVFAPPPVTASQAASFAASAAGGYALGRSLRGLFTGLFGR